MGPAAQMLFSVLSWYSKYGYSRRESVVMSDGVAVYLDVKEEPGLPLDAPLVLFLHGIGEEFALDNGHRR